MTPELRGQMASTLRQLETRCEQLQELELVVTRANPDSVPAPAREQAFRQASALIEGLSVATFDDTAKVSDLAPHVISALRDTKKTYASLFQFRGLVGSAFLSPSPDSYWRLRAAYEFVCKSGHPTLAAVEIKAAMDGIATAAGDTLVRDLNTLSVVPKETRESVQSLFDIASVKGDGELASKVAKAYLDCLRRADLGEIATGEDMPALCKTINEARSRCTDATAVADFDEVHASLAQRTSS